MEGLNFGIKIIPFLAAAFVAGLSTPGLTGSFHSQSLVNSNIDSKEPIERSLPDHPPDFVNRSVNDVRFGVLEAGKKQFFDGHNIEIQTTVVEINSDGYRDELHNVEKPENTTRIIGLGDCDIWMGC